MDANLNPVTPVRAADVRLSWTQKLDLLGMSAAAVMTTALIAAPMIGSLAGSGEAGLDTEPYASFVTAVAAPESRPVAAAASTRGTALASATRSTASHPLAGVAHLGTASPAQVIAANAAPGRSSKPLGRRLAGLFTGDGTYAVRPFPTVPSDRQ